PEAADSATVSRPDTAGATLRALFAARGSEAACVIVEPVAGNMGCVPPEPGFLEGLLELTGKHGALCIFDEVITGCRLAPGGAQERYGVRPDLTCLGKIVGGGMPLAVYGGRRDAMSLVSPLGPVYQAGTLSGNPVAVSAALATLGELDRAAYERLDRAGQRLAEGLERALRDTKTVGVVQRVGSMLTLFFHPGPIRRWNDA